MKKIMILSYLMLAFVVFWATNIEAASGPGKKAVAPETATPPAVSESQWPKIVSEAKKEGKVTAYTIIGPATRQALSAAFKKKYGVDLEFLSGARGAELTQKLLTERRAGLYLADVVIAGSTDLIPDLKPKGLLEPMDPFLVLPEVTDPNAWTAGHIPFLDKQHMAVGMLTQYLRHLIRNTEMVREGEITSYKDLLKPQWKGKMVLRDPTTSGNGNTWITLLAMKVWGLEATKQFMQQLAQTEPVILRDPRLHVEWVAKGKYPLGIATRMENTAEFVRIGAPIAWVNVVEGGLISAGSSSLGVVNQPAHPNATKLFINWMLSREGQAVLVKGYGYPSARRDVPPEGVDPGSLPAPGEKFYLDDEENILAKRKMLAVGKEIFGALVK